ncbi:MFS transporter [Marmoricola sp. Leaf446]|nr:MFS transporter [Marmoricola sp. Leaf446]
MTSDDTPRGANGSSGSTDQGRRAALAGFFGTALEYYDMYIYAAASALVFSRVFFPDAGATGLLLSLGTYGVAYLARPLGGFVAGHFGDRFGRRNVMIATLLTMGVATFAIGCLPSYGTAGILAPSLLVVLRLLQGLSVGGELSGTTGLTIEHAPEGRRASYSVWALNGSLVGYIIATLAFIWVASLPEDDLLAWGWRVPFWASAVIALVGLYIRRQVEDPEVFEEQREQGGVAKVPLVEVLRRQPADVARVVFSSLLIVVSVVVPVYGLSYATSVMDIGADTMLWAVVTAYAIALVTQPFFAALSDRVGRKPVLIGGNIVAAVAVWEFFWAVSQRDVPMIYLGMVLCFSVAYASMNGVYPAFFSEMFATRVRVTGMAVGLQVGLLVTGFSPLIVAALSSANADAWWPAAVVTSIACVISIGAISTARETHRTPIAELGRS